jgi:hypothetical protein
MNSGKNNKWMMLAVIVLAILNISTFANIFYNHMQSKKETQYIENGQDY